jgi:NAD(P)-dependent dehydrogenase (short-subunit alcohol dehydrogenase family)
MSLGSSSTTDEILEGIDLSGRRVVITGASGGLGLETARALADHGAEIMMLVRDPERGAAARSLVGDRAQLIELDLVSLAGVRAAGRQVVDRWPTFDVLINNAGVMATPESQTLDGFELQLGVNHLGHFLLTALLAPAMSDNTRVVTVSSLGHLVSGFNWEDPHFRTRPYSKWEAYGQSKTANILFTIGLAARGRIAYAVHPGKVGTDLYRHLLDDEMAVVGKDVVAVEQGAATIVWSATASGIPSGSYLADCSVAEAMPHATDPADAQRLWSWSERQVNQVFPG